MTLVLDAGALIALERNERAMWVRLKAALNDGELPATHAGILGQVWRAHPGQARLARALSSLDIRSLDPELGRKAGQLLARSGLSDVIDAALVAMCHDGDRIITSDTGDLAQLAAVRGCHVEINRP